MFAQQYYPSASASSYYGPSPSYDTYYPQSYDDMYYSYAQPPLTIAPPPMIAPPLITAPSLTAVAPSLIASPLPQVAPSHIAPSLTIHFPKVSIHTLYIPYISDYYTTNDIRSLFSKYCIAMVKDVDFVSNMNYDTGIVQRSAYVHIDYWFYSRVSANFVERLESQKKARLVVNDPEYWIILPSTAKKHIHNGRKLCIDLDACNNNDAPPLVNTMVVDEYTAYEYEKLNEKLKNITNQEYKEDRRDYAYQEDIPFESDACSYLDMLELGLRHEDDRFSDDSIEEYRRDRNSHRKSEYSKY